MKPNCSHFLLMMRRRRTGTLPRPPPYPPPAHLLRQLYVADDPRPPNYPPPHDDDDDAMNWGDEDAPPQNAGAIDQTGSIEYLDRMISLQVMARALDWANLAIRDAERSITLPEVVAAIALAAMANSQAEAALAKWRDS